MKQRIEILKWEEDITLKNVDHFRKAVLELLELNASQFILDLEKVKYVNSSALGIIADSVMKSKKNGKELVISGIDANIEEIFNIVKFSTFMKLFKKLDNAVAFFEENTV